MPKRLGALTYEGRYVIITVSDDWIPDHGLPPSGPDDEWFDNRDAFLQALAGPYDRLRIGRQPWTDTRR